MAKLSIEIPDEVLPVVQEVFEQILGNLTVEPGAGPLGDLPMGPEGALPMGPEGALPISPEGALPPGPEGAALPPLPGAPLPPMNPEEMALQDEIASMGPGPR